MKIKLAILEKDANYLNRIVSVFNTKYSDNFEIYSFTDKDVAMNSLEISKVDILLANDAYDIDKSKLPKRCMLAYLVDSNDIDTYNDQRAIGKFQKVDLIYKQILSVYAENAGNISRLVFGEDPTRIIAFQSVGGGCGASTMAAAAAIRFASLGKKTLYLNLEKLGSADCFFSGEGAADMSEVIFALKKAKKTNISIKLESCVKQDLRGVYFFSGSKVALDMMELKPEDIILLISELKLMGSYDVIVLDLDFSLERNDLSVLEKVQEIVWVGDGSDISNSKLFRAVEALRIMEENFEIPITGRICSIYNKFSNKTGSILENIDIKRIGGAPRIEHATTEMILKNLSEKDMLDALL